MSKLGQVVGLKMPFDSLSGKLATKQKGLIYGSPVNENEFVRTNGKVSAKNFSKYIVCTMRNGVIRFYVKSRTSVNNTLTALITKASLAVASLIALWEMANAVPAVKNGLRATVDYFNEKKGGHFTVRGYIIQQILPQLREKSETLVINFLEFLGSGAIRPMSDTMSNPFNINSSDPHPVPQLSEEIRAKFYEFLAPEKKIVRFSVNGKKSIAEAGLAWDEYVPTKFNNLGLRIVKEVEAGEDVYYVVTKEGLHIQDPEDYVNQKATDEITDFDYVVEG